MPPKGSLKGPSPSTVRPAITGTLADSRHCLAVRLSVVPFADAFRPVRVRIMPIDYSDGDDF